MSDNCRGVGMTLLPFLIALLWLHRVGAQENVWSGFVNEFEDRVDYRCPDDLALSGIASDFVSPFPNSGDRRWEFYCSSGGGLANVSVSCSLQSPINTLQSDIDFNCPRNGYLAGFVSVYTSGSTDRVWQPYCCVRPFARVVNCQVPTTNWQNILRDNLNVTSPDGHVIAGLQSFYFNRDRRWRFRTCEIEVDCGDPGVSDNAIRDGNSFLYDDIVTFTCNHGYYQSSGPVGGVRRCLETGLWSDQQPICSLCTQIADCADIRCSNTTDHSCVMCESDNGPARGEAAFTNLGTECQPKCSWLGTFCYPGVCPDVPMSCNCTDGFGGSDCLRITQSPDFQSCSVNLEGSDGSEVSLPCQPSTNLSTVYTNIVPYRLTGEWGVVYDSPTPFPDRPAYVNGFLVGVATSEIQATLYRAANPASPVSMTTHPCEGVQVSSDTPLSGMVPCSSSATPTNLTAHTFLHGDSFEVSAVTVTGGYLDITNLDTALVQRHYYEGSPSIGTAVFIIDLRPPTHCSLVSSTPCSTNQNLFSLSGEIVSTNPIAALWGGWIDAPSGVSSYEIDVYHLELIDGLLTEGDRVRFASFTHTGQLSYEDITSLPGEGPYSFILQSHDQAGNTRYTRQTLLYDFSSSMMIDPFSPLTVVSAVPGTNYLWQNTTLNPIVISGIGHFYNSNLRTTNYLAPLANFSMGGSITQDFDQVLAQGRYPRAGTNNALGVVQLTYDVVVDQVGGASVNSMTRPNVFPFQSNDIGITGLEITTPTNDGDSVRVWFRAIDFRFQESVDSVLVHIDSSPPVLSDLGLEWNGDTGLSLHGTGTLLDLDIRFQTLDEHSGVLDIEWILETISDSVIVGSGRVLIPSIDPASCVPPSCSCDPLNNCSPVGYSIRPLASEFVESFEALHDTDYIVTVTVTNHALLTSTLTHTFTVDATPPVAGHVIDGSESRDIDFQTTFELSASWTGFFDRESDVHFYQYIIDTQCANSTEFTYPLGASSQAVQTTVSMATRTAPSNGTYYVTVVAYNQALQPSIPACSDGVTIDTVSPEIVGVVIPGATVDPGLVRDVSGDVWYVREDRARVWVGSGEGACLNLSTPVADLSAYPIRYFAPPSDVCLTSTPYTPSQVTHLTTDTTLNVTWEASDNIGIRKFEVGIVSADNFTQDRRNVRYFQTAGQEHYSFFDYELLSNGNMFYLSVHVVDLAQLEMVVNIGPILIDVTPPIFNGSLEAIRNEDHVTVTWDEDVFTDDQSGVASFEFAIGQTEFGIQVSDFQPLPPPMLPHCHTHYCVAIDTTMITPPLLSGRDYYITIKSTNQAGLSTYIGTSFTHISQRPSVGYVVDIDTDDMYDITQPYNTFNKGIDVLVDSDSLALRWGDFVHSSLEVVYYIALGTQPGLDDVVPLTSVGMATEYQYRNLTLVDGYTYFSTVLAVNSYGSVNASSNGVLVLKNISLSSAEVFDGLSPVDSDYQASKSAVSAMWVFPNIAHLSHYEWGLYRMSNSNSSAFELVHPFMSVGAQTSVTASIDLEEGVLYMSAVRACLPGVCLDSIPSDGFQISIPPRPRSILAVYTPIEMNQELASSSYGSLELSWERFDDPHIVHYEWSIGTGELGSELLVYWTLEDWFENEVTTFLNTTISLHKINYVSVRGYNSAGLYSTTSTRLEWNVNGSIVSQSNVPRTPLVVFDITDSDVPALITDNWKDIEHHAVRYTDIDYIGPAEDGRTISLSAAWPTLRYTEYSYSISTKREISNSFCRVDEPGIIACGVTIGNTITVSGLELIDSERYYFCVQGLRSDAIHPTSSTPNTLTHCSNGVTVDLSPPVSGCVQIITPSINESDHMIGSGGEFPSGLRPLLDNTQECSESGGSYQVSSSEIFIVWSDFSDVEMTGNSVHVTGVAYYQYAIGTSPGAVDVVGFTSVGVATYAVARGLSLESGITYYTTVRAYDFVGHMSEGFSQAVTIDTTPPDITHVWIQGTNDYLESGLDLKWNTPFDLESGIASMEWGLGSLPGSNDVLEWAGIDLFNATTGVRINREGFYDGQVLFLTVKVLNQAGLPTVTTSLEYRLDSTPPVPGLVYDGPYITAEVSDIDYSSDLSMLSSHWAGFVDPHSDIVEYLVAMGTSPGREDVQKQTSVGMATSQTLTELTLVHGQTYYTTVIACNALGLCSNISSNGITVDVTPPISGRVLNTYSGPDIQFQASRSTLSARWYGFHDDESSIQHYTYYIGLYPNDSSIIQPTKTTPTQTSFVISAPFVLPSNRTLYTTVVAWNGAGLKVQASTSGVYVDDTPPDIVDGVSIVTEWAGSVGMTTQYSSSAVRLEWRFADTLTSINQQFWTLISDSNVQIPIPGKVVGSQSHTTCGDLSIKDGDTHQAIVIGCNQVGLCVQSTSESVLFDSSPPIDGYFGVFTQSAAILNRTVPGGMTWRNRNLRGYAELNIAFLGFSDPHSGISEYWVSVGTRYGSSDLMPSLRPEIVQSSLASEELGVSLALVPLNRLLTPSEVLYISLWAVNGVGLKSLTVQGSFMVDPQININNNGTLSLLRSSTCVISSCLGHCTCGTQGQLCTFGSQTTCDVLDHTNLPSDRQLVVRPVSFQLMSGANDSTLYTAVTDKLIGEWTFVDPTSNQFQRLEWSVSEQGFPPGVGVVNTLNDGVWRDVNNETMLVFSSSERLHQGVGYMFHIRAWYSNNSYADFTSNSITVDTVGTETVLGERVRVVEGVKSVSYTSNYTAVSISFDRVFSQALSGSLSTYQVAIGDSPRADNILQYTTVTSTLTTLADLNLRDGRTYFVTVITLSPLGVITTSISDRLLVDLTPPNLGHAFSGSRYYNVLAQNNVTTFSARWFGFNDPLSGINHYELALTNLTSPPADSQYTDVGIDLRGSVEGFSLMDGEMYFPHLIAVNNAGLRSQDYVFSRGLVIDSTAPIGFENSHTGLNILSNPSFEGSPIEMPCPDTVNIDRVSMFWTFSSHMTILTGDNGYGIVPYDGCNSALFTKSLSQSFTTVQDTWYRLSLVSHKFTSAVNTYLSVTVAGVSTICEQGMSGWVTCEIVFKARTTLSRVEITTDEAVIVDNLIVTELTEYSQARNRVSVSSNEPVNVVSIGLEPALSQANPRIHANWLVADPQSGIKEFLWAMGTVPGGQQKQSYRSTGTFNSALSDPLSLTHTEGVYVTVIATNFAGLTRVFHSERFIVDLTPPTTNGSVFDGLGYDLDYQSSGIVWADWTVAIDDQESGLLSCRWAIGTSLGATDIQSYVLLPGNLTSAHSDDLSLLLPHGTTVYSTVTCLNKAGLHTTGHSDGVTILTTPPETQTAYAIISSPDMIQYDIILGYLPSNRLILTWGGFIEPSGAPLEYEVRLTNESGLGAWQVVGFARQLTLNDIQLPSNDSSHVIEVRAVNVAGLWSERVHTEFVVLSDPPVDTGSRINDSWLSTNQLSLDWSDKFLSPAPLRYELSLGTQRGSGSIQMWVELSSTQTSLIISDQGLMRNNDYFISLNAIGSSGLHVTSNQVIAGLPIGT